MKRYLLILRSFLLWVVSGLHFFFMAPFIVFLSLFFDPRTNDAVPRAFCRRVIFLAGARIKVQYSPNFDPRRTSFFMVNHVNLFDPFVLCAAIPQRVRGWELESHFKIFAYGWLMKRFGNIPVPDVRRPADLKRMWRLTRAALDSGTSLIIFPEAARTRDGYVGKFEDGAFRVAQQMEVPIVPVSLVGSFQHFRTGRWMLHPSTITVVLHDTIETASLTKADIPELRDRIRAIIAAPVQDSVPNTQ